MKKLVSILCAAALALSLAACGAESQSGGGDAKAAIYSLESATTFTFSDSGITAQDGSYTGYEIDGTTLTIDGAGAYVVTGACADGSIQIKKGTTGVTLALNGLALTSADTAPILCGKSTEVVIVAADGSTNSLTDAAENNDDSYPDNTEAENAVIKCKDGAQVTLCGGGALTINANGKNGIKSGASTTASLTIRELTLTINAPVNDAINAQQLLNGESGTLTISAADDAIHSDLVLNIGGDGTDGPTIAITECCEGLEAAELNVLSGNIDILSSDDCLNAANSDLSGYDFSMNISGGVITACSSSGDGFDSNGDLTISSGTVVVWTANTADNQPLDADGAITVSGGTVLAAGGSAGMGMNLTAEQPCVTFGSTGSMGGGRPGDMDGGSASIAKDAAVTITDSDGSDVYSGTALCNANFVFFSSPELTADGSYTLTAGDTSLTASAQTGSISSGGMGGMGGPGNGGQFPGDRDGGEPPESPDGKAPDFSGGQPPERPGSQKPDTPQNS
mgnify:CR=1 FL=1